MHPFGREEESSLQELFGFFTQCLQHGEWQLAGACVRQLADSSKAASLRPHSIVRAIITHPYPLEWETVGSPHRLAWFWLQIQEKWTNEKVSPSERRELEFLLLLEDLVEDVPESVLKEVHQAFLDTQLGSKVCPLRAGVESCLQGLLKNGKPRLAQCLISFLKQASAERDQAWDYSLEDTFIHHSLERLRLSVSEGWMEEVCSVLALMPWSAERPGAQLEGLWEALWRSRDEPLRDDKVLSSLLRPHDHTLVYHYCSTSLRLRRDQLLRDAPHTDLNLPEAEKLMLVLCCHGDRQSAWKTIFFESLSSGKHFLEQVLVTGLDLVKREAFGQLETLLHGEFHPLARLLLLLGWTQCQSLSAAHALLRVLHLQQASANDTVLSEFISVLNSQLAVLDWCVKNNLGITRDALLAQLHTLDSHSALYVLHSLTPLAEFEERRILDLLLGLQEGTDLVDSHCTSAQRNVTLYQGFCAMKYALYALCVNAHAHTNCTECASTPTNKKSSIPTQSGGNSGLFQHLLSECQLYLEAVPAMFRLELLENIFSLLFLSSGNFTTASRPTESTEEGGIKGSEIDRSEGRESVGEQSTMGTQQMAYSHLDLGHLTQGCRGFLVDAAAMEGFLRLLREGLEGICALGQGDGRALAAEVEAVENLGCSVTAETFSSRLQRLSKRTAEAQWRLQIVTNNQASSCNEGPCLLPLRPALAVRRNSSRRRKRVGRHRSEQQTSTERQNGEFSTSTSDGGGGAVSSHPEKELCPCGGPHSWLVPAMLSPPESLLISCIRRGNYTEAQQVMLMFGLETSGCSGELLFMERYREVLQELTQVEHKIESQSLSSSSSSEGLGASAVAPPSRSRLGSSGRSTLQAIGSAAAAGMAFYSISDVADRLLSSPSRPVPALEEGYWLSHLSSVAQDPSGHLSQLLAELSPPGMAAFDLACCHCQLWKTSRQLLETAERRLLTSLESRGYRIDTKAHHFDVIRGFPAVLQQISKILNRTATGKGPAKTDGASEEHVLGSPFGCSAQEVLLSCNTVLTDESIASRLNLAQRLEVTLQTLSAATDSTAESRTGGALLSALVEQAGLKQSELDSHPVRSHMKQLLRSLDQLCPFEPDIDNYRVDYIRSFLDYVNTLASVLVRSLSSEDQSSEVKLGNPLLVLLQSPSQLLSHLLFERQVSPDRVLSLLQQENVCVNLQQVVVHRCCEPLPFWDSCGWGQSKEGGFGLASISSLLQEYTQKHCSTLEPPPPRCSELSFEYSEVSSEDAIISSTSSPSSPASSSSSSSSSPSSFLLTQSAMTFLKSRCPLLATLACLSASRGEAPRAQSSGWSYFRGGGRKEAVLDGEQISREADTLLKDFPILRSYLQTMAEPVLEVPLGSEAEEAGSELGTAVCGKPLLGLLLSGVHNGAAQALVVKAFQQALASGDLSRGISLLELYGQKCSQQGALRDRLLACAALEDGEAGSEHLFRVWDTDLRARVALQGLDRWPLETCLDLLSFCLSDVSLVGSLRAELQQKREEMVIYKRMLSMQPSLPWETWQELREESKQDPETLLAKMQEAQEFDLCSKWVQLYTVSDSSRLQLQTEHLLYLLEKGKTEEAFQLLEGLSDFSLGLEISERALDRRPGLAACHFLADYLTMHFQSQVSPARRCHIHALHLGSKVLLTLPEAVRQDYFLLLSEPLLMLEQLLMNLKVDWADTAVRTLRKLLVGQEAGFSNEDIDSLLSRYAHKALEFPYAPRERSRSDSVISLQDVLLQCPAQESCPSTPSSTPPPSAGNTPMHTPYGKRIRSPATPFTPPEKPPVRKDWIPDHQQAICMVCQRERFTMFNRRHHCRRCGRLVCHACSIHRMKIDTSNELVRVCDQCYTFFHPNSEEELEQAEVAGSPVASDGLLEGVLCLPEVPHRQFKLSTNPAENQQLHSEFYYEQAPSASLCVAILSLHSDHTACGHQLISHCRSISRKLTNPEVDARLLTDIMGQLIFSAKLMFVNVGRSQDLALCDSYISKVDVLKILVRANYKYIPSLDDILETAAVTRLRNQLLEAEYYHLAVEVSTKSGLDPSGVWHAWGMASLKAGNLSSAREKFARCMKPPMDRNQLNNGPRLLQEILQHLESSIRPTLSMHIEEDVLASLRELEEALSDQATVERLEGRLQNCSQYQECLYYLHTYGTHLALVRFHMHHDGMKEALSHLLTKECPDEVFLEGILQPSLEQGRLGDMQGLMESLDSTLEVWNRYLIAACQILQRRGHFHTLYQLQQFMVDHVRAAMTCIRFFTHGAQSYLQLGEQQRWLVRAKEHLRTYLQEQQGRGSTRKRTHTSSFRKKMSSSDVSRHMNTIELQLEVTRFLHRCEISALSKTAGSPTNTGAPPTLFGGNPIKIDVACKVMLGGKNIEEGFGIAYRVIQDFQLEALSVYMRVGQRLVRQRQYGAVRQLLKCVGESGTATKSDCDAIILSCVSVADKAPADAKELDGLILESKSSETKIKAYLQCSKLRAAYLLAVKLDLGRAGPLVQDIFHAAESSGDTVMQDICRQWLSEHQERVPRQRQGHPK
ncbi:zinc finger FYVE domain-containing protein 26 isoform X3 [Denticeps clupeoides]|uniref:zinc finger FYVE domain-containing protein 26 isoform X3 n=1 Tax=Denticeps clupeoides TaxID=299321 RepID=UPI0010A547A6|nr:zinc finger FYVE domain-containing protein 26 isoform X3 [Denticeps clupeoides]